MSHRSIRCPLGDWAQAAPSREAAIELLCRHINEAHCIALGGPQRWLLDRYDVRLAELGVEYVPPNGRYVPALS